MQPIVKKEGMVKGIIGYRVLDYKSVEPTLMQLKSAAMQYPGYVDAEFRVSEGDQSIGLLITTWEKIETWKAWVGSKGPEDLRRRARTGVLGDA